MLENTLRIWGHVEILHVHMDYDAGSALRQAPFQRTISTPFKLGLEWGFCQCPGVGPKMSKKWVSTHLNQIWHSKKTLFTHLSDPFQEIDREAHA